MEVVRAGRMEWGPSLVAHRAGNVAFKRLFEGAEGSPDNFALVLANEGADYFSPRHRHNWDQVRYCLEGAVPIGRDLKVEAGEVAYFPEGVPYGPQEGGPNRLVLVLQFGGASGQGYMSAEQSARGRQELLEWGRFENGVFHRERGEGRKTQDAYEAIWEDVFGDPVSYPPPRYKTPVVIRAENFPWHAVEGASGAGRKVLGRFPERNLTLEMLRLDGPFTLEAAPARRLLFVTQGTGRIGTDDYEPQTAIRLEPGETVAFTPTSASEMLVIAMPLLERAAAVSAASQI